MLRPYIIGDLFDESGLHVNVLVHLKLGTPWYTGGIDVPSGASDAVPIIVTIQSPGGVFGAISTDITFVSISSPIAYTWVLSSWPFASKASTKISELSSSVNALPRMPIKFLP